VVGRITRGGVVAVFLRWASRLRFPYLLLLVSVLFVGDLIVPDVIPFADEIILGLVTALLASLRKKPEEVRNERDDNPVLPR